MGHYEGWSRGGHAVDTRPHWEFPRTRQSLLQALPERQPVTDRKKWKQIRSQLLKVNHDHTWGVCRTTWLYGKVQCGRLSGPLAGETLAVRLRWYSQCSTTCVHIQCSIASTTPPKSTILIPI